MRAKRANSNGTDDPSATSTRTWAAIAAGIAVFGVVTAVLVTRGQDAPARSPLVDGVCRVASLASDGDVDGAKRVFVSDVHGPLHELAAGAAQSDDRAAAARLLEVKERIESSARGPSVADADELVTATLDATRAIGKESNTC